MDSKIQVLTDKIYTEGVQRGQAEAERLIAEARERAKVIEQEATEQAKAILQAAKREVDDLRSNTQSELQLYARQLQASIRSSIVEKLTGEIVQSNVKPLTTDVEFMQRVVLEMLQGFDLDKGIIIESPIADELRAYFASNAKDLLSQGVEIRQIAGQSTLFTISPVGGDFKIQVGEEDFVELFKHFLRPQLANQLF